MLTEAVHAEAVLINAVLTEAVPADAVPVEPAFADTTHPSRRVNGNVLGARARRLDRGAAPSTE